MTTLEKNKEASRIKKHFSHYFFTLIKESKIFLLFSFFSCFLPILYCLFAAMVKPNGSQAVMAIGYVSPFLLAFLQIAFTISMIILSRLNLLKEEKFNWKNDHTIMSGAIWMSLFIGAIMTIFYVFSTFFYIYYSTNKPNTQATLSYSLDFIATSIPVVLFFPLYTTSVFFIYNKNKKRSILSLILTFLLIAIFSWIFCAYTNLKINGLAIGTILGLFIGLFYNWLTIKLINPIIIYYPMQVNHFNILISKTILRESFTLISLSLFKGIAILAISFVIPLTINGFVPLSYQMSRVLWFNMMYFIPFLGIGFGEGIRAHYLNFRNHNEECYLNHTWKSDFKIIVITFTITLALCIGGIFIIKPLAYFYTLNDNNPFENGILPEIEGWGSPISPPSETIDFEHLKDLQFTQLPEFKPTNTNNPIINVINRLENIKLFKEWVQLQINNNQDVLPVVKKNILLLQQWFEWFEQLNNDGKSLIGFLQEKYNFILTDEINNLISGKGISQGFVNCIQSFASYYVYLWLYSTTNPIVTESFISLRPIINFNNVINSAGLPNALVNYSFNTVMTSLFLNVNTFNAKSMIYVCIFSLLNSVWAILLQTNQRNLKRGLPWWLMITIYGVCIGGLVTFGVLFGVTLKETLGSSNPFQYLDAWTFPLIIISISAISVVGIISYKSWKYLEAQKNNKTKGAN